VADTVYSIEMIDDVSPAALRQVKSLQALAAAEMKVARAADAVNRAQQAGVVPLAAERALLLARRQFELQKGLLGTADAHDKAANAAKAHAGRVGALTVAMGNLIARGLEAGVRGVFALGAGMLETADHIGKSRAALTAMMGSSEASNAAIESATKLARIYGFSIADTIDEVKKFTGLGFNQLESDALVKLVGDMQALGLNAEATKRVLVQLGQIQSKGKLQGDELRVLAENGVSVGKIYDALGRRLGKTRAEILKMQAAGQLKSGDTLNAIAESVVQTGGHKKLGEVGAEKVNASVGGIWNQIGTQFEEQFRAAVEKAEPRLVAALTKLKDSLAGVDIAGAFQDVATILGAVASTLAFVANNGKLVKNTLIGLTAAALGAAAGYAVLQYAAIGAWVAAAAPVLAVIAAIAAVGVAIGMLLTYWDDFKEGTQLILSDLGNWISGVASSWYEAGKNLVLGLVNGVMSGVNWVKDAVSNVANIATDTVKGALGIQSPSRVFAEHGHMIDAGLASGIDEHADLAFSASSDMAIETAYAAERGLAAPSASRAVDRSAAMLASEGVGGGGKSGVTISLGGVTIVLGDNADQSAVEKLQSYLETDFVSFLERHAEGMGA
jgi:tape measure domain-containing protein